MKRILGLLTAAGAVAGAVWYARQQREPQPSHPAGEWAGRPNLQAVPEPAQTGGLTAVPDPEPGGDDLTAIKGIGPKYAEQLSALGITTISALAAADPADLAAQFDPRAAVEEWIDQARERNQA